MKKLFAILMSMLLLCSMIPFAAVSAAGEYSIELVADAEEVNAGDEVTVEVSMYGHEDLGLIGAQIELGFDPDVFELVTYYDEDEEMWMPPIEVGPKFSASSNKYILFSPIDEETGYMERCLVQFLRSTATATQAVKTNLFYTVTFKVKDTAPSGTYEIDVINHNDKNIVFYGLANNPWTWEPISITVNGSEPECEHEYTYPCDQICSKCYELTNPNATHSVKHVDAVEATCYENGNVEYWYCEYCGAAWLDEAQTQVTNMMSIVDPMGHGTITHVEAKEPTCFEDGNIEYWYCEDCGQAWLDEACTLNTNLKAVVLPMAHDELTHVAAKEPTCTEEGNIEYWYCEACGMAWLDAEGTLNTNLQAVKLAPSCKYNAVHTAAKEANCFEEGNVEYWYCETCDVYYLDADCTIITNAKSVILPVSHNVIHVEAKEPTCFENGNIEYWYCDICGQAWLDEYCHLNTNLKAVVLPMAHDELTHVAAKEPTCTEEGNIEYWYCEACGMAWLDAEGTLNTNLQAVKLAPSCKYNAVHTAAKEANCFEEGNVEYWYCETCDVYYLDADCTIITNAKSVILPVSHNVIHVEAKEPTCFENGNIEYWYCDICGQAWLDEYCHLNTNLKAVVLPMAHDELTHVAAKEPTCTEEGNIEYWYCEACGMAWLDAEGTLNTNLQAVKLAPSCKYNAVHTAAKEANCFEEGNVEYWYCETCDVYYLDADCTIITNAKSVILPVSHNVIHVAAKDATCTELGNIEYWYCDICGSAWLDEYCHLNTNLKAVVLPMADHTYDDDMDVDCNVCGDIRVVEYEVKTFGGNSIAETNDGLTGLAFKFSLTDKITGMAVVEGTKYVADYSNAYVTPNSTGTYKLVKMGAKVSNGKQTLDIPVKKIVLEGEGAPYYAIRIINIPEDQLSTLISCTPYFVYEDDAGQKITVELDSYTACAADFMG